MRLLIFSVRLRLKFITQFKPMSYYHIYNRGAHKALVFRDRQDYIRMIKLLYIANNTEQFLFQNIKQDTFFSTDRKSTLVNIIAYCLMPNHIHIAIKTNSNDKKDSSIFKFMLKLCTAYSMYFNYKYDHQGTIWQGPYKRKISFEDIMDMKRLVNYIHLNPYGIKEPNMTKEAKRQHPHEAWVYSLNYDFSSLKDFLREASPREQKTILSENELEKWR